MKYAQFGYQGLSEPFDDINTAGQKVTYYPTGRIINQESGDETKMGEKEKMDKLIIPLGLIVVGAAVTLLVSKYRGRNNVI